MKSRFQGLVKWFDKIKSFGFITSVKKVGNFLHDQIQQEFSIDETEVEKFLDERANPGNSDLFVHANSIIQGNEEEEDSLGSQSHYRQDNKFLKENDEVTFFIKLVKGKDGEYREQACYVVKKRF